MVRIEPGQQRQQPRNASGGVPGTATGTGVAVKDELLEYSPTRFVFRVSFFF